VEVADALKLGFVYATPDYTDPGVFQEDYLVGQSVLFFALNFLAAIQISLALSPEQTEMHPQREGRIVCPSTYVTQ
jgi:hypothetical protein